MYNINIQNIYKLFITISLFTTFLFPFNSLVGIMVEFQYDQDPETSGDGTFLLTENFNLDFIHYENVSKCNTFLVDKPPHNSDYFLLQLLAVKNYYNKISNNSIDFDIGIIDTVFQLNNNMKYYSTSDQKIGELFSDAVDAVNASLETEDLNLKDLNSTFSFVPSSDILYVVFHAGLGQESSTDFDPTIYDIRSAYVDEGMLENNWIFENNINHGLVLPETLNMIYYNAIEDAIPTNLEGAELENIYCNQQFGMTGLFAYLLGYSFEYPPLHNFENGQTRVGVFDLMDIGFFNGHGVIPSPPSAWIRSNQYLNFNVEVDSIFNNLVTEDDTIYSLPCRLCEYDGNVIDKIYRIDISNDEYFLLENRNNLLSSDNSATIDNKYATYYQHFADENFNQLPDWFDQNNNFSPAWFDVLVNDFSQDIEIDGAGLISNIDNNNNYNVITSISNYDAGLPGSGILIWHINEPEYNNGYEYGINDNILDKAISLEEGDGSEDIGDLNVLYGIWSNEKFISGSSYDFWYYGNSGYKTNNNINGYNNDETIYFNDDSFPNSKTNDNVTSKISIRVKSTPNSIMTFEKGVVNNGVNDPEIYFIDDAISIIGNNNDGCVYYIDSQNNIFEHCVGSLLHEEIYFIDDGNKIIGNKNFNGNNASFFINNYSMTIPDILFYNDNIYFIDSSYNYYIDETTGNMINDALNPIGYFNPDAIDFDTGIAAEVLEALSLGNLDDDIYNEKIFIQNGNLIAQNYNGSYVSGYPVYGSYTGIPLVLNLYNEYSGAEVVCQNNNKIDILSANGELIYEIPIFSNDNVSALKWDTDDIALVNGDRLYIFQNVYDESISYWMNSKSRTSNYPKVTGLYNNFNSPDYSSESGIELDKCYNYPNPITNNSTTFRFFVYDANSISVDIYDITGYKVKKIDKSNLSPYEYNEIIWDSINLPPGLYFASVKSDFNQTKVLKIVIE